MIFYSKDTHVDHDFKKRKEKKKNVEDNPAVKNLMLYRTFVCAQNIHKMFTVLNTPALHF